MAVTQPQTTRTSGVYNPPTQDALARQSSQISRTTQPVGGLAPVGGTAAQQMVAGGAGQTLAPTTGALSGLISNTQTNQFDLSAEALGLKPGLLQANNQYGDFVSADARQVIDAAGKGAYEHLLAQGFPGKRLTSGEAARGLEGFQGETGIDPKQLLDARYEALLGSQFQFDANSVLPGIQQTAGNIFAPQQAQLEAIRQLQTSQYSQNREETAEAFDKEFNSAVENMNRRGAYFSGGAIQQEGDIRKRESRAQSQLGLAYQAADFGNLTQQAMLQNDKNNFITDALFNAESSAFNRYRDQRDFTMGALDRQWRNYTDERDYTRHVFEDDRNFALEKENMQKQWGFNEQELELAKDQFNLTKEKFGYAKAMDDLKASAKTNSGDLGYGQQGDSYDWYDSIASTFYPTGGQSTVPGPTVFDINSYL